MKLKAADMFPLKKKLLLAVWPVSRSVADMPTNRSKSTPAQFSSLTLTQLKIEFVTAFSEAC